MGDSQSDPKIFSTRIVAMDYYMAAPIPDVDFCYSSFQGGKVNEVPVIRIYGSTPAGQKTCLHIHKALPYLYIPCADLSSQPDQEGSAFTQAICLAIEKALKLKGNAGSKRQHVHSCTLVRAKKFYGYHSCEELFMKIHLFHPQDISRVSNLLLGGVVLDKVLQPYESHIPFLLQFLIDYNLYGMGHIHLSKIKFRHPVPEAYNQKSVFYNGAQGKTAEHLTGPANSKADLVGDQCSALPIWTAGTLPDDWMWPSWSHSEAPSGQDRSLVKRQSNSELEGDAVVEGILNQLQISYELLSQSSSEARMVQSLVPIWEEERERSGIQGPDVPRNSGKPLPEDVLRMLSHWHDLENTLLEKFGVITPNSSAEECIKGPSKDQTAQRQQSAADQVQIFGSVGPSNVQTFDQDALGLLKWLASSQAVEEINSDDELAHETILSPLLPATTIAKVLEKANTDFECLSQQECQDILDSVEDSFNEVGPSRGVSFSDDNGVSDDSSSNKIIPQVDGSGDDYKSFTSNRKPTFKLNSEPEMSERDDSACGHLSLASCSKRKLRRWGSLPVSVGANLNFSAPDSSNVIGMYNGEKKVQENAEAVISSPLLRNGNYDHDNREASSLSESSMRELMRKKRCYRTELPGCSLSEIRQVLSEKEQKKDDIRHGDLRNDEVINRPHASVMSSLNPTDERVADSGTTICPSIENSAVSKMGHRKSDFSLHGRSPVSFGSRFGLLSNVTTQRWPAPAESLNFRTDGEHISGFQDTTYGSSELVGECKPASKYAALDNHNSAMCIKHDGSSNHQSEISHGKEIMFADPVVSNSHTPFLLLGENSKMVGSTIKCPCQTEISVQEIHEISDENPKYTKVLEGSRYFPTTIQIDNNHEMSILHPGLESSKGSRGSNLKVDSSGLVGMTLCQKPPVIEFTSGLLSSVALSPSITHDPPLTKGRGEGSFIQPEKNDRLPPFFMRDRLKGNKHKSVCCSWEDYLECGNNKGVMGVPIHYQNDGSHLYILAPLLSPPSGESVKIWLLDRGTTSGISRESASVLSTSLQNLSVDLVDSEVLELTLSGFSLKSGMNCNLSESTQHNQDTHIEDLESRHDVVTVIQHKEANCFKSKAYFSQGMSQLSGPDSKSKLTPLSQIGFRDPASIGGTQQLTILSIEVQAESRGDLRPNPKFDPINIIALVFQADDDPTSEAIILLLSNKESSRENLDGIRDCKVLVFQEEKLLFNHFVMVVSSFDPDMLMGWDIQGGSLGFLAERAAFLGIDLLNKLSRTPSLENVGSGEFNASGKDTDLLAEGVAADSAPLGDAVIEDEWGRTHASGVHVGGRIVLNIWRLMRNEVKLNMYTVEAVAEAVLRRKIPFFPSSVLTKWFTSGPGCARHRCMEYILERAKLNIRIMDQLDMINRTSELARVFGIDFFSVLSRGSQYRVESMFLRLAHTQNYLAISPGSQQVAYQPAMECLPLVMEPESGFYADPVVVLDFQSLYPSMIIAYNLCFSTCLGKILPSKENTLGVSSYSPDRDALQRLKEEILVTPNGVMYVPSKVRKGILPRLLEEILSTRIMIKQAMKKLDPSQQVLHRIFNARQLALKLIANVTYGYTAAGFSGRMPCAEIADSIVQCGRRTLEHSISFVSNHASWKAKVVYGDTDSMFVLLKGRSLKEAFKIGSEIAAAITAMNPDPVVLKMEKVYHPCFLLTKKRYVGYSYECPDQIKPKFDAKGIETVRRDTCVAVSKTMEQSLRLFFEHKDIDKVKSYLLRQWRRIMSGRISLQDFVFAKEVRLGTYSARANTLPPGAIIATKAMKADPRAEPRYAERIPYVVVHGEPGARLVDMVVDPLDLLAIDSPFRLNDVYYIRKQIIPALQRVFGLVGADLNKWYSELPRPERESLGKRHLFASNSHRTRIDFYYMSRHCILCRALVHGSSYLCRNCSVCDATLAIVLTGRTAKLEKDIQHLVAICRHCGGGDWLLESGVKCTSLACSVLYERRKVQKELRSVSAVATETGFYPTCMAELF